MKFILKKFLIFTIYFTITIVNSQQIKVACIGDSITFGAAIHDRAKNSYPAQLEKMLGKNYIVKNFGINGTTLLKKGDYSYWQRPVFKEAQNFKPNIVIIKLGTNDTKINNWRYKDEFINDYVEMIKIFQYLSPKTQVYICYPVPVYKTIWTINDATITNEIIPKMNIIAQKTNAQIIDIHNALNNKESLFPDKIHPNKEGAKIIAQTIITAIQQANIKNKFSTLYKKMQNIIKFLRETLKLL